MAVSGPWSDLADHIGLIVAITAAFAATSMTLLGLLRKSDKGHLESLINILRKDLEKLNEERKQALQNVNVKLDDCRKTRDNCPFIYMRIEEFKSIRTSLDAWREEIMKERRVAWRRQEVVNMTIFSLLDGHTHAEENGKTIRSRVDIENLRKALDDVDI